MRRMEAAGLGILVGLVCGLAIATVLVLMDRPLDQSGYRLKSSLTAALVAGSVFGVWFGPRLQKERSRPRAVARVLLGGGFLGALPSLLLYALLKGMGGMFGHGLEFPGQHMFWAGVAGVLPAALVALIARAWPVSGLRLATALGLPFAALVIAYPLLGVPEFATSERGARDGELRTSMHGFDPDVPGWAKVSEAQLEAARSLDLRVAVENRLGLRFVLIPPGDFWMGSAEHEIGRSADEALHRVRIARPFYLSIHETTIHQYRSYDHRHESPFTSRSGWQHESGWKLLPVSDIVHGEATTYAGWLSGDSTGRWYRLPTEAEWEYACRAGTRTRFSWGDRHEESRLYANANDPERQYRVYRVNGPRAHFPVGSLRPNPWGLYDMHGNVAEWCAGWYAKDMGTDLVEDPRGPATGRKHPLRGGTWSSSAKEIRSAARSASEFNFPEGFRLLLEIPENPR